MKGCPASHSPSWKVCLLTTGPKEGLKPGPLLRGQEGIPASISLQEAYRLSARLFLLPVDAEALPCQMHM